MLTSPPIPRSPSPPMLVMDWKFSNKPFNALPMLPNNSGIQSREQSAVRTRHPICSRNANRGELRYASSNPVEQFAINAARVGPGRARFHSTGRRESAFQPPAAIQIFAAQKRLHRGTGCVLHFLRNGECDIYAQV